MKKKVFESCPKYLGALTWNHPVVTEVTAVTVVTVVTVLTVVTKKNL